MSHDPFCLAPKCDYDSPNGDCFGYEDCWHRCECILISKVRADERAAARGGGAGVSSAYMVNGPSAGRQLAVADTTQEIVSLVLVSACEHAAKPLEPMRITYKPIDAGRRYWTTDFDADVAGWWCQKCAMSRLSLRALLRAMLRARNAHKRGEQT